MVDLILKEGREGKRDPGVVGIDWDLGALKAWKKESVEERWEGGVGKGSVETSGSHEYLENNKHSLFGSPVEGE